MKSKFHQYSVIVVLTLCTLVFVNAYAQSEEQSATIIITEVGLELTKQAIQNDNYDSAIEYSALTNNQFGENIQFLRKTSLNVSDEIHIGLLDLHSSIISKSESKVLIEQIEQIQKTLTSIPLEGNSQVITSDILSEADEMYQTAMQDSSSEHYFLAVALLKRSEIILEQTPIQDKHLSQEINSFFSDLEEAISNKSDFVTVGNLITAIQRDLVQTETIAINKTNLYDVIRNLYSDLFTAINSDNYSKAEEIAIEAYLENFEYLEPDIKKADEHLLNTLEINMREEIRDMIKQKEEPNKIRDFVKKTILPDLAKAEAMTTNMQPDETIRYMEEKDLKAMGETSEDQKSGVKNEIDVIRQRLEETLAHYRNGDMQSAHASARSAYLDSYEFVEIPLRTIDPDFTLEVEYQFATLRSLIKESAPQEKVQETVINIRRNLDESERIVTGTGEIAPAIAFTSSFAVIFREGLESVLILGAVLTYLEASRNTKFKPYIYYGIVAAIGATAVTWLLASYIIDISGASRELVEAIAALSATAVLFYVSFWILNKIEHKKWMEFVKAKVWQAGATGGFMIFVMLSFFTVYREGFETVLFYQAMFGFAEHMEMYVGLGFILGIISLLGLFFVMRKLGKRLPLRILFGLTMGIGAYLSIAFLGNAIRELQILDVIPYTSMLGIIPRLDINMAAMTGIYPTLETLIGQLILLGVYLFAASYVLIVKPRKEEKLVSMRKSRKIPDGA
jgi:high-affinity iron transporter